MSIVARPLFSLSSLLLAGTCLTWGVAAEERMHFTLLEPSSTGLVTENTYAETARSKERFSEFIYGAIGTGIAVGDYDQDGKPDLFVVSKTEGSHLFHNEGNWRFRDTTNEAGVRDVEPQVWKQGATFVDVDNDGWLDLYLCRWDAPNRLWINQRDGTFREEAARRGVAVKDASGMASFADYDKDGWLDLYLVTNVLDATQGPEGQADYLFHNRGDGTFEDVTTKAGINGPGFGHSATWWDFDEDGWPDVYVANDFAGADRLYRNLGDGTFEDVIKSALPYHSYSSMGADVGDLNGDGHPDLLVGEMAPVDRAKDQRGMSESRAQLNRPGAQAAGASAQVMRNTLFLGSGRGVLREAAQMAGLAQSDWTWSVRCEDFDCDGMTDVFVTNGMVTELHNSDMHARLRSAERPEDRVKILREMAALPERNLAFHNRGDLEFEPVAQTWGLDDLGISFGAATGDFDGDGDLDLVVANYRRGLSVYRNDAVSKGLVVHLKGIRSNRFGIGAKVTLIRPSGVSTRWMGLARGYLSMSEPVAHFGLGNTPGVRLEVEWPSGIHQSMEAGSTKGSITIEEPAGGSARVSDSQLQNTLFTTKVLDKAWSTPPFGDEPEQPALRPWRLDRRGPFLAAADLNEDGREDVVMSGTTAAPARIFWQDVQGTFIAGSLPLGTQKVNGGPIVLADFNSDGRTDILITRGGMTAPAGSGAFTPSLLLNQGKGTFSLAPDNLIPALTNPTGCATVIDMDHDGRAEFFLGSRSLPRRYPLSAKSSLWSREGARWADVSSGQPALANLGIALACVATDVDGDGWTDLVVATDLGLVRYLHNDHGTLADHSDQAGFSAAGAGRWACMVAGDFNGDGRPDFAVGNIGLNTPYRGTVGAPDLFFLGSFKGAGSPPLLIEGFTAEGKSWPRRARSEIGSAVPEILKRFPKNDAFATTTLSDLFGEDKLQAATRFALTQTESGLFLSGANGTYHFAPFPRIAQIAPVQGLASEDFNQDGKPDLLLIQNNQDAVPSSGPFTAGLGQLLLGRGDGTFEPVAPDRSGLFINGATHALVQVHGESGLASYMVSRPDMVCIQILKTEGGK